MFYLTEQEVLKIERINEAFTKREDAEAAKEAQKKLRVLFERTAQEALPFVVYVIYMGAMGLVVVFKLLDYEGTKLWIGAGLLAMVMLAPLVLLPRASLAWLGRRAKKVGNRNGQASPETKSATPSNSD